MTAPVKSTPKDAQVMAAILKDMGVTEHEPRVINLMLEFAYRYVTDVLDDAKVYSIHAGKKTVDVDDVKLSIQSKLDHSFTTPPPRDLLMDVARHKNSTPMPLIKPYIGPRLPPDRYCLSAPNYKLKAAKKNKLQLHQGSSNSVLAMTPHFNMQSVQGKHGSQLGGMAKPTLVVTKSGAQPTVTIKPSQPMPIIRLTSGSPSNPLVTTRPVPMTNVTPGIKRKRDDDDDYDT